MQIYLIKLHSLRFDDHTKRNTILVLFEFIIKPYYGIISIKVPK